MTELAQLAFKGAALGSVYSLVALGFVIVFKSTGVINFAQGSLMLLGAYVAYNASVTWDGPFWLAVAFAVAVAAGAGLVVERLVLRRLVGQPAHAVILATIGLAIIIDQGVTVVWGFRQHSLDDPWGSASIEIGPVVLASVDVAAMALAACVMVALWAFFRGTRLGLALRAGASDQEAAAAQGISPTLVGGLAWGIAAATAAVAGILLSSGTATVHPELGYQALRAFPAVILGGLDSIPGAVAGGLAIGLVEVLTAGYAPTYAPWLGTNFHQVMPYVVMLLVLAVRPAGLLGSRTVRRL